MKQRQSKKQKAFMLAYEPIHENFVRFCKAKSHGIMAYEDLVNESVLKVFQKWETIQKKESLLYFLFTTARNIVNNALRKKKELSLETEDITANSFQEKAVAETDLEIQYLYQQMNKLTEDKKEALILFEINGFSIKEVAEIQNSTEGAVKVKLSRARRALKTLLEDAPKLKSKSIK